MEEARVRRREQRADDTVVLVARARDCVVAAVGLLEITRGDVKRATKDLVGEQLHGPGREGIVLRR